MFADEGCTQPLNDPETSDVLAESFLKPALVNGKPVDGIARVRLADLVF